MVALDRNRPSIWGYWVLSIMEIAQKRLCLLCPVCLVWEGEGFYYVHCDLKKWSQLKMLFEVSVMTLAIEHFSNTEHMWN